MSAPAHTAGPWSYARNPENTRWIIDSAPAHAIACTAGHEPDNEANARRIVECVNALEGIPNPAAIAGVVAALAALVEQHEGMSDFDIIGALYDGQQIVDARQALASLRGEA
jgi:hypothetical protein